MRGVGTGVGDGVGDGLAVGDAVGEAEGDALGDPLPRTGEADPEAPPEAPLDGIGLPVGELQPATTRAARAKAWEVPRAPRRRGMSRQTTPGGCRWLARQSSHRMGYGCVQDR